MESMDSAIKKVIVSRFAEDDLNEIIEYYNSLSESYVQKTVQLFEHNILKLKEFPKSGRFVPELEKMGILKFRELIQGNYRIVYEINNDVVIVHTIIDARRNFEEIIFSKLMRYY
jgi:toxin ParE1/3/4